MNRVPRGGLVGQIAWLLPLWLIRILDSADKRINSMSPDWPCGVRRLATAFSSAKLASPSFWLRPAPSPPLESRQKCRRQLSPCRRSGARRWRAVGASRQARTANSGGEPPHSTDVSSDLASSSPAGPRAFARMNGFSDVSGVKAQNSSMISLFGKPEPTLLEKLKDSVSKTRTELSAGRADPTGDRPVDPELLKRLESALLGADIGVRTTKEVLAALREQVNEHKLEGAVG